jgi:hypothetical protein
VHGGRAPALRADHATARLSRSAAPPPRLRSRG